MNGTLYDFIFRQCGNQIIPVIIRIINNYKTESLVKAVIQKILRVGTRLLKGMLMEIKSGPDLIFSVLDLGIYTVLNAVSFKSDQIRRIEIFYKLI